MSSSEDDDEDFENEHHRKKTKLITTIVLDSQGEETRGERENTPESLGALGKQQQQASSSSRKNGMGEGESGKPAGKHESLRKSVTRTEEENGGGESSGKPLGAGKQSSAELRKSVSRVAEEAGKATLGGKQSSAESLRKSVSRMEESGSGTTSTRLTKSLRKSVSRVVDEEENGEESGSSGTPLGALPTQQAVESLRMSKTLVVEEEDELSIGTSKVKSLAAQQSAESFRKSVSRVEEEEAGKELSGGWLTKNGSSVDEVMGSSSKRETAASVGKKSAESLRKSRSRVEEEFKLDCAKKPKSSSSSAAKQSTESLRKSKSKLVEESASFGKQSAEFLNKSKSKIVESSDEERSSPLSIGKPMVVMLESTEEREYSEEEEEERKTLEQVIESNEDQIPDDDSVAERIIVNTKKTSTLPLMLADDVQSIVMPPGVAGVVGQYLVDINRPVNMTSVVQKFKDTYTRPQLDKALVTLVARNVAATMEDGSKIYWINQTLVEESHGGAKTDSKKINDWMEIALKAIMKIETDRNAIKAQVNALMSAPADDELEKLLADERKQVKLLEIRVNECENAVKEAEKLGKSAAEVQAQTLTESRAQLLFFRSAWRERKRVLSEFLYNVCDTKGLKNAAKRELYEKIGVETDDEVGAVLVKGAGISGE